MYSHFLMPVGRADESVAEARRALFLDPLDVLLNLHLGWAYVYARRYDDAIKQLQKTNEMDPNLALIHTMLGWAYVGKKMYGEAIMEFQRAITLSEATGTGPNTWLGHAYAESGKKSEAVKILDSLKERYNRGIASPFDVAVIQVGLGDKDQTLEWLQKAYQERSGSLLLLKVEPVFDSLRQESEFRDLLAHLGLPQ